MIPQIFVLLILSDFVLIIFFGLGKITEWNLELLKWPIVLVTCFILVIISFYLGFSLYWFKKFIKDNLFVSNKESIISFKEFINDWFLNKKQKSSELELEKSVFQKRISGNQKIFRNKLKRLNAKKYINEDIYWSNYLYLFSTQLFSIYNIYTTSKFSFENENQLENFKEKIIDNFLSFAIL
jgi:hypothetical protein